jgi:hypothetical protein
MRNKVYLLIFIFSLITIVILIALFSHSQIALSQLESDNAVLRSDNSLQSETIVTQSLTFNRANKASLETNRLNSLIGAKSETTVIQYREILKREKTCDLLVPAYITDGLLEETNRLRASAMYAAAGGVNEISYPTITASQLTYCQAVLWIHPLLATIEQANNQLAAIRQIEEKLSGEN